MIGSSIKVEELSNFKDKPDEESLGFGNIVTDRMLTKRWRNGEWGETKIVPYDMIKLDPTSLVFHYGQAIFEGLKAYRQHNGEVVLFRPSENAKRFAASAERMAMPSIPVEEFVDSLKYLVNLEKDWVPNIRGSSLYIRPVMIAIENALGVRAAKEYLYYVVLSPSGPYFKNGSSPLRIKVEDEYIRAAPGGTGMAKFAGNYAGSLLASKIAKNEGCDQVLWLDAIEREFVEEAGAMNIAFVINNEIHSPVSEGTILNGITRSSIKMLASDLDIEFVERKISIHEVLEQIERGNLTEIFGIGTAAVISPIGQLKYKGKLYTVNHNKIGSISQELYDKLTGIHYGTEPDIHNWTVKC